MDQNGIDHGKKWIFFSHLFSNLCDENVSILLCKLLSNDQVTNNMYKTCKDINWFRFIFQSNSKGNVSILVDILQQMSTERIVNERSVISRRSWTSSSAFATL